MGLCIGLLESGWVLSGVAFPGSPSVWLGFPLAGFILYGPLGWILGRLLGNRFALPADLVFAVCVAATLALQLRRGLPPHQNFSSGTPTLVFFSLLALALWVWGRKRELPALLDRSAVAIFLSPFLIWLGLAIFSEKPFVATNPGVIAPTNSPNVVLVTWDTVRADTLPLWGGGGLDSPGLDQLAAEGVVFADFRSVAPITGPAHASILTGLYPPSHGMRANGQRMTDEIIPRMAELFRDHGWDTGAFVSALPVHAKFGFAEGFDYFDERRSNPPLKRLLLIARHVSNWARPFFPASMAQQRIFVPATQVVDRASNWLQDHRERPVFLWLHWYDAHTPYSPPADFLARAIARKGEGPHAADPVDEAGLIRHRAEVEQLDSALQDLRRSLEAHDPGLKNTLVFLVSDHGECFGEGGIHQAHDLSLYSATQHVPAVLRGPGVPKGTRSSARGSQVDIFPTLCALSGIPIPADIQGVNLLAEGRSTQGRYSESWQPRLDHERQQGWELPGWSYTRAADGQEHLFALAPDGKEGPDLAQSDPARVEEMRRQLGNFFASLPQRAAGALELTAADSATLNSLGYVGEEDD